jgi:hypothetical protein
MNFIAKKIWGARHTGDKDRLVALSPDSKSAMKPELNLPKASVEIVDGVRVSTWYSTPESLQLFRNLPEWIEDFFKIKFTHRSNPSRIEAVFNVSPECTDEVGEISRFRTLGENYGTIITVYNGNECNVTVNLIRRDSRWYTDSVYMDFTGERCNYLDLTNREIASDISETLIMILDHLND